MEKVVKMERAQPFGNFLSGFEASHFLQLSTKWKNKHNWNFILQQQVHSLATARSHDI